MRTQGRTAPARRSRTIAIVGAGFSGTALAVRLLREPADGSCRIVLIERSGRFGSGLAYRGDYAGAQLNVPAARMSLDERDPDDFREYLRTRGILAWPDEFIARRLYGDYLESRLAEAERAAPTRVWLTRLQGTVCAVTREGRGSYWNVALADGQSLLADTVVLAFGHFAPRTPAALQPLVDSGRYHDDPWRRRTPPPAGGRVLLVGTGLTMADVAVDLGGDPQPPREIVAISRRGLLSLTRREAAPCAPASDVGLDELARHRSLRALVAAVRRSVELAAASGIDWRDVVVGLREHVPTLWKNLSVADRRRFARHLQPYWDVHRHQLPPVVGRRVHELLDAGRLEVRAARIVAASLRSGQVIVSLQPRGRRALEVQAFDQVINCSGPDADPRRVPAELVQSLLRSGLMSPDPAGAGIEVDPAGRLVGADGRATDDLFYLGPWLRARDLEATAVHELRLHATALANVLRHGAQAWPEARASVGADRSPFVQPGLG